MAKRKGTPKTKGGEPLKKAQAGILKGIEENERPKPLWKGDDALPRALLHHAETGEDVWFSGNFNTWASNLHPSAKSAVAPKLKGLLADRFRDVARRSAPSVVRIGPYQRLIGLDLVAEAFRLTFEDAVELMRAIRLPIVWLPDGMGLVSVPWLETSVDCLLAPGMPDWVLTRATPNRKLAARLPDVTDQMLKDIKNPRSSVQVRLALGRLAFMFTESRDIQNYLRGVASALLGKYTYLRKGSTGVPPVKLSAKSRARRKKKNRPVARDLRSR